MNVLLLVSGLVAGFCTVGHFMVGSKSYLKPMLQAPFDDIAKNVMHCVFHYVSVFLVLTSITLLLLGLGIGFNSDVSVLIRLIAIHYAAFAIVQVVMALVSGIDRALFKMFQWMIFVVIAVFAWLGAG